MAKGGGTTRSGSSSSPRGGGGSVNLANLRRGNDVTIGGVRFANSVNEEDNHNYLQAKINVKGIDYNIHMNVYNDHADVSISKERVGDIYRQTTPVNIPLSELPNVVKNSKSAINAYEKQNNGDRWYRLPNPERYFKTVSTGSNSDRYVTPNSSSFVRRRK